MPDDHDLMNLVLVDDSDLLSIYRDAAARVIVARRRRSRSLDGEEMLGLIRELLVACADAREGWGLVFDVRAAPGNSDPAFEAAMVRGHQLMLEHFDRVAVLVRTELGSMQAERVGNTFADTVVTIDEAAAWAFAAQTPREPED